MKVGRNTLGHAFNMQHYSEYRPNPVRKAITGMGEYAWTYAAAGLPGDGRSDAPGDEGLDMRKREYSYFAIWTITNYWPNLLDVSMACCTRRGNRTDNVDGWGSDQIRFLQRCLHPYVVCDSALDATNVCYSSPWPSTVPALTSGSSVTRRFTFLTADFAIKYETIVGATLGISDRIACRCG